MINFYRTLKKEGEEFIQYCQKYFQTKTNQKDIYYQLRDEFNQSSDVRKKSAVFLYLNRHGYNGLCRYNKKGAFNVPFGRYEKPNFPQQQLLFLYKKLKQSKIENKDFETIINKANPGDVIYCDPPYVPLNETSHFTAYVSTGFDNKEQIRLAKAAENAAKKGINIIISNHETDFTHEIYHKAKKLNFPVRRMISCNGQKREFANELLVSFPNTKKVK